MDYQFYKLALKYLLASKILSSTVHLFVLSFQYNENTYIYPLTHFQMLCTFVSLRDENARLVSIPQT